MGPNQTATVGPSQVDILIRTPAGTVVVHNSQHERPRQHSNLTHELAHVLLGLHPARFRRSQDARGNMNLNQTAEWLGASQQLTRYRANTTGVTCQYRRFSAG